MVCADSHFWIMAIKCLNQNVVTIVVITMLFHKHGYYCVLFCNYSVLLDHKGFSNIIHIFNNRESILIN